MNPKKKLGDFLIDKGVISKENIASALDKQRATRDKIGSILINEGYLSKNELINALSEFLEIPLMDTSDIELSPKVLAMIPKAVALKHGVVPVNQRDQDLMVACTGPIPPATVENLRRITGKRICPVLMGWEEFSSLLERAYRESTGGKDPQQSGASSGAALDTESPDYAVNLVDGMILRAASMKASDIHIEPEDQSLRIRYRIDGVLHTVDELPLDSAPNAISRVKVMANMNIAERRSPQDGSFAFSNASVPNAINIRVSSLPRPRGEKVVMRLLPSQDQVMTLENLGMEGEMLKEFEHQFRAANGLLFVTGPTGSGKSTTLYSVLKVLRSDSTNITTVEDPIELQMQGINQTQVDHANKLTFPRALRSILRQDPDIIMVGEVRDQETAELALQASLTGHLVFSTLHTNDARSAFIRLLDMGCEPYLVSSAVRAVLAQRLIRTNCPSCTGAFTPDPGSLVALGLSKYDDVEFKGGKGCVYCHGSGFKGRTGIFELLVVDNELRHLVVKGSDPTTLAEWQEKRKIQTLKENGVDKIRRGLTTPQEVMRVTL